MMHLPFAGITLFRFYGCDLSLVPGTKHPGITTKEMAVCSIYLLQYKCATQGKEYTCTIDWPITKNNFFLANTAK
jgi:hypothetical protein